MEEIFNELHKEFNSETFDVNLNMPYKFWSFSEIKRGDCTILAGGMLTLYVDGTINWRCDIRSSDSGDEWDGDFICYSANDVVLWQEHFHFDISSQNVTKRWDETRGANPSRANSFNEASKLSFNCNC